MTSPELSTAVFDLKIQAATVNTGSGMKDGKLKSKDFFDVEHNPFITFHSTKVEQTGPDTIVFDGDFTIRGVTKQEKLTFTMSGKGTGAGRVKGTMAFDRKAIRDEQRHSASSKLPTVSRSASTSSGNGSAGLRWSLSNSHPA